MLEYERTSYQNGKLWVCGVDEAGRGPLAGPVVAAAVIFPKEMVLSQNQLSEQNRYLTHINDSKKLTQKKREFLFAALNEDSRVIKSISSVDEKIIDQVNIFQATLLAMREAIAQLSLQPDHLLLDGKNLHGKVVSHISSQGIDQGDSKSLSIAAASILAKVYRDQLMLEYDQQYPQYGFRKHKGYGTREHLERLKSFGPSPIHRLSFAPLCSK